MSLDTRHVILDTRPSRFSREYVEKSWVGPGNEARWVIGCGVDIVVGCFNEI